MPHGQPPTPEDVGRRFWIPSHRPEDGPVGKPDEFEDVIQRQLDRGPERQAHANPRHRRLHDGERDA